MPDLPPRPRVPSLFQIFHWVFRPIPFMQRCAETYGDAFTLRIMGATPIVFFSDPAAIKQVFTGDPERLRGAGQYYRQRAALAGPAGCAGEITRPEAGGRPR